MKKVVLLLLLAVPMFGEDYKGVPIPKGITMAYDRLEDQATFRDQELFYSPLDVVVWESEDEFMITGSVSRISSDYAFIAKAKIFIEKGKEIVSFVLDSWDNAKRDTIETKKGTMEVLYVHKSEFSEFLVDNLKDGHTVTVRFYEPQQDFVLEKGDMAKILAMLEFRNRLQAALKK